MRHFILIFFFLSLFNLPLGAEKAEKPINKLLYMYRFFYLPFSIEFKEDKDIILPLFQAPDSSNQRLFDANELKTLHKEWDNLRLILFKKSLLENNIVPLGKTVRISLRIFSHNIPLFKTIFEKLSIEERIELNKQMKDKPLDVQSSLKQVAFFRSFIDSAQIEKFNFFIVGASWCSSSREYRLLFETYAKEFVSDDYVLHSIVVDDQNEKIFNSDLIREMFPHDKRYSHNTIPKFIALQQIDGKTVVWEEGEALKEFYERFFMKHVGYLNDKTSILKKVSTQKIGFNATEASFLKK